MAVELCYLIVQANSNFECEHRLSEFERMDSSKYEVFQNSFSLFGGECNLIHVFSFCKYFYFVLEFKNDQSKELFSEGFQLY